MECIMRVAVHESVMVVLLVVISTGDLGGEKWGQNLLELWLNCQHVYFFSEHLDL